MGRDWEEMRGGPLRVLWEQEGRVSNGVRCRMSCTAYGSVLLLPFVLRVML